jgi:hypothetical protein
MLVLRRKGRIHRQERDVCATRQNVYLRQPCTLDSQFQIQDSKTGDIAVTVKGETSVPAPGRVAIPAQRIQDSKFQIPK